jgi:hypothetical protein
MSVAILGKTKTERVIQAFVDAAPPLIGEYYTPRCCLNATWILQQALAEFDVAVRPLIVDTMFFNRAFTEMVTRVGRMPSGKAEIDEWFTVNGAHSVGTVRGKLVNDDGFVGGHVVGVVKHYLIDASARQFRRVEHQMPMPDVLVLPCTPGFLLGTEREAARLEQGCVMTYHAFPEDTTYEGAVGFSASDTNVECVRRVVREMKKKRLR